MENNQKIILLKQLTQSLELPDTAYEKAINRYEDLGDWFDRDNSALKLNLPHIFPQGSFRLGTAIKPINEADSYDLDLACNIRAGFAMSTHSQKQLKEAIGNELEGYRVARAIKSEKKEKQRCWRLEYADTVNFHMDIVPCIPETESNRRILTESMQKHSGLRLEEASNLSNFAVCITDNSDKTKYEHITNDWQISNPEGYAKWFELQMSRRYLNESDLAKAQIDSIPLFKRKTPLQQVIQLLKRHRDVMFASESDAKSKPISIIITTIVAAAYSGASELNIALEEALKALNNFVNTDSNRVTNPVNPDENFADKWASPKHTQYNLKKNFHLWVRRATRDFNLLLSANNAQRVSEVTEDGFAIRKSNSEWSKQLGLVSATPLISSSPKNIDVVQAKPWCKD